MRERFLIVVCSSLGKILCRGVSFGMIVVLRVIYQSLLSEHLTLSFNELEIFDFCLVQPRRDDPPCTATS